MVVMSSHGEPASWPSHTCSPTLLHCRTAPKGPAGASLGALKGTCWPSLWCQPGQCLLEVYAPVPSQQADKSVPALPHTQQLWQKGLRKPWLVMGGPSPSRQWVTWFRKPQHTELSYGTHLAGSLANLKQKLFAKTFLLSKLRFLHLKSGYREEAALPSGPAGLRKFARGQALARDSPRAPSSFKTNFLRASGFMDDTQISGSCP